jgi:hypothetical protein
MHPCKDKQQDILTINITATPATEPCKGSSYWEKIYSKPAPAFSILIIVSFVKELISAYLSGVNARIFYWQVILL